MGVQTSIPYSHSLIIGFLPLTLFWLPNTKHCCIISVYFSQFSPFKHTHLPPLPFLPPVTLSPLF